MFDYSLKIKPNAKSEMCMVQTLEVEVIPFTVVAYSRWSGIISLGNASGPCSETDLD